ncbi:glycerophosphodiester phosphodiesterase family protein [Halalkalibacterium halodurans]|uniref:Glycerophosphodiester phosphodiesterase n=1 Tax=Halalkalibacterium halodurans (strain ATCC BAA-125 / DSM 18197 / FERM 7344 / JCM 9153 / C-125) TaxID=272558 RepID=Q9KDY1_HALH5|nr:glycerophosphodiester phosphodiesterase family protein [Halalkalibacterium halodurans]MED4174611.1 glycerophosphodiester phosphodiesterase family protein [Halalkalibacterium halodurans]BAB04799.1 glycerophosphodiester phosphodiesterase [Halalkalibacterium halodurans C-125]
MSQKQRTHIYAHRGVSCKYPENTLSAFRAAEGVGADGIELDVQLTKDDQLIVIHDLHLNRTTSGSGLVRAHTLSELKRLDAGSWFDERFTGETLPTLDEVFAWAQSNELIFNVELKGVVEDRDRLFTAISACIDTFKMRDRVILSSFDHVLIKKLSGSFTRNQLAVIVMAALYDPGGYVQKVGATGYHFYYLAMTEAEVYHLLHKGLKLRPFTLNQEEDIRRYMQLGVNGIFTDDPELAIRVALELSTTK